MLNVLLPLFPADHKERTFLAQRSPWPELVQAALALDHGPVLVVTDCEALARRIPAGARAALSLPGDDEPGFMLPQGAKTALAHCPDGPVCVLDPRHPLLTTATLRRAKALFESAGKAVISLAPPRHHPIRQRIYLRLIRMGRLQPMFPATAREVPPNFHRQAAAELGADAHFWRSALYPCLGQIEPETFRPVVPALMGHRYSAGSGHAELACAAPAHASLTKVLALAEDGPGHALIAQFAGSPGLFVHLPEPEGSHIFDVWSILQSGVVGRHLQTSHCPAPPSSLPKYAGPLIPIHDIQAGELLFWAHRCSVDSGAADTFELLSPRDGPWELREGLPIIRETNRPLAGRQDYPDVLEQVSALGIFPSAALALARPAPEAWPHFVRLDAREARLVCCGFDLLSLD